MNRFVYFIGIVINGNLNSENKGALFAYNSTRSQNNFPIPQDRYVASEQSEHIFQSVIDEIFSICLEMLLIVFLICQKLQTQTCAGYLLNVPGNWELLMGSQTSINVLIPMHFEANVRVGMLSLLVKIVN